MIMWKAPEELLTLQKQHNTSDEMAYEIEGMQNLVAFGITRVQVTDLS